MRRVIQLILSVVVSLLSVSAWGEQAPLSIAFYYDADPPVNELKAFDFVVVEPGHFPSPERYGEGKSRAIAYVSVGETLSHRSSGTMPDPAWLIGENPAWRSGVVDVSNPAWQSHFLDRVIEPLWQAGYRGYFLDTLDSYRLSATAEQLPAMEAGIVTVIRTIKERHPEARLILNRGFEIFPRVSGLVSAVAAESLFRNFNPVTGEYGTVPDEDREWLVARLREVQEAGVPAVAIDYVDPADRQLMRQTAGKIRQLGFSPWVADKELSSLGVGMVEVMPRTILGLYDGSEGEGDAYFTNIQRYAVMPLNYLGYTVRLHDLREPLPDGILSGRYAGVVVWPNSVRSGEKRDLKSWVLRCIAQKVPVLFLERFGVALDQEFARSLGLELVPFTRLAPPVRIVAKDPALGFEQQPLPTTDTLLPIKLKNGRSLLQLATANGVNSDAVAITPWGGYVSGSYVVAQMIEGQTAWVLDPFIFFTEALRLPVMPVPDTTTENGARLLLVHVDGDGFDSRAEWPGGRLAAEEMKSRIFERYQVPTTVSVIASTLAPNGLNPDSSARFEEIARGIFALPWVEGASHSFSHPFRWQPQQSDTGVEAEVWHAVKVPGYSFDLDTEINGSLSYINERLMPPGKKARTFLWTGNCLPSEEALRMTYQAGALNINGGGTLITQSNRTLTAVAPLGIYRGPWFQAFAPNQNENVYTRLWTDNFYGHRRVIETFRLTDAPRRLKPVNIYYHFYSATKDASLAALGQTYDWAGKQRLFAVYTSEYLEKVLDFNRTVIARTDDGWLVRNNGNLRELRIPASSGYPELGGKSRIAGFHDHGDSRYLHMAPGGEAMVRLASALPETVFLKSATGYLERYDAEGESLRLTLRGYTDFELQLGNVSGCVVSPAQSRPFAGESGTLTLTKGRHELAISCR